MKSNTEVLGDNKIKITVDVEAIDVNARIKKQYKDIAKKYNFPGFRPGRAPRPVIDATYGKDGILAMVAEDAINELYPLAVDDCGYMVTGTPKFDENNDVVKEGADYTFSFTIGKKPEYELSNYDAPEIEMPPSGATDSEIDTQVDILTKYYVSWEDAGSDALVKEDSHVDITLSVTDSDGEKIDVASREKFPYALGAGLYPAGLDEKLVGMKSGEKKSFDLNLEKSEDCGSFLLEHVGETLKFDVQINSVKREVKPEITDEWVSEKLSYDSVEELRKLIAEQIIATKEQQFPDLKEARCLEVVRERLEGEPPADICEETESSLLQDFFTQLQRQGTTFDAYLARENLTRDEFKEDVKKQARDVAVEELAVEAWARKFNIEATEDEVSAEFEGAGLKDPKEAMKTWRKQGRLHTIREAIVRRKAMKDIMDKAEVKIEDAKGASGKDGAKDAKDSAKDNAKGGAKDSAGKKKTTKKKTSASTAKDKATKDSATKDKEGETKKKTATKTTGAKKQTSKKETDAKADGAKKKKSTTTKKTTQKKSAKDESADKSTKADK